MGACRAVRRIWSNAPLLILFHCRFYAGIASTGWVIPEQACRAGLPCRQALVWGLCQLHGTGREPETEESEATCVIRKPSSDLTPGQGTAGVEPRSPQWQGPALTPCSGDRVGSSWSKGLFFHARNPPSQVPCEEKRAHLPLAHPEQPSWQLTLPFLRGDHQRLIRAL